MESSEAIIGLARLSGLLVHEQDLVGVVSAGILEACACVGADAGGVLVRSTNDRLDVLASTSHRVADLEAYQAAAEDGPCVESMRDMLPVSIGTPREANTRWRGFGDRMTVAGYQRVYAVPMRWQGTGVGGLNLFWKESGPEPVDVLLLQTFADILTLAAVHVRPLSSDEATARLQEALEARGAIEQAKGVLAWQHDVDMDEAFTSLRRVAEARDLTLGEAADAVIEGAEHGETL